MGHTSKEYTNADPKHLCFQCGEMGHTVFKCRKPPNCPICRTIEEPSTDHALCKHGNRSNASEEQDHNRQRHEQWCDKPSCISIHATHKSEPLLVGTRFIVLKCRMDKLYEVSEARGWYTDHTGQVATGVSPDCPLTPSVVEKSDGCVTAEIRGITYYSYYISYNQQIEKSNTYRA